MTSPSEDETPLTESPAVRRAATALAAAHRVVLFSGAGMSAESGISTFRDPEVGVWRNKIALALFSIPFGWRWMPSIAWWGYKRFHRPIAAAVPNAGHVTVAQLRSALHLEEEDAVQVITQNVDGLHQRAGSPACLVYEVHGSVWRHRCVKHGHEMTVVMPGPGSGACLPETQPRCEICGSPARPDAVLFTECLPAEAWANAEKAVQDLRRGDVLLVVGTSGLVQPAASLPRMCRSGVVKIEVNTEVTGHSGEVNIRLAYPSAVVLPAVLQLAREMNTCRE